MKILLLKVYPLSRANGGDISVIEALSFLKDMGFDISVRIILAAESREELKLSLQEMHTPLQTDFYDLGALTCKIDFLENVNPLDIPSQLRYEQHIQRVIEQEKPDSVVANYTDYFAVTSAIKWNAQKTGVLISDNEFPRQSQLNQYPSIGASYLQIKTVLVPSPFLAKTVKQSLPWARTLKLYNLIDDMAKGPVHRKPNYWLFVNPIMEKGLEFAYQIAERLPEERFVWVSSWGAGLDPKKIPNNVTIAPRQSNLWNVFSQAKGLLMPSVWQEGFGRIPLEAMAAGIPVISSDRGNLKQTMADGGVILPLDVNQWLERIQNLSSWEAESRKKGFQRAKQYREETSHRYQALVRMLDSFESNQSVINCPTAKASRAEHFVSD